jgi:hypothetical protein
MHLGAAMNGREGWIRAELYLTGAKAKSFFDQLLAQKEAVERELGYALVWDELPEGRDSRISVPLNDVNPLNRSDWPRQHEWLAKHLNDLHRVFCGRVKSLIADWSPSGR